jgi:hypothetical protein
VTREITLPLRYETEFQDGPTGSTKPTFELDQAVVPFRLTDNWALITRTKLAWVDQPPKKREHPWSNGLSNGYTTFFLSPEGGEGFYWGAGPLLYYPATNSNVGVKKWGAGPSLAFVKRDESPWEFGAVANNIWSQGGPPLSSERTNELMVNPAVSYHFGNGWSIGSSPNITVNWLATGAKWTVPVGGGISRVVRLGGQPIKFAVDSYYNAVRPEASSDTWLLEFTLTFLFQD